MQLQHKALRRLWPSTLGWQLTLPFILGLGTIAVYMWFTVDALTTERRNEVVNKIIHVSKAFQNLPIGKTDNAMQLTESFLLLAAEPPIQQIAIIERDGRTVLAAQRPAHGEAYLHTDSSIVDTPPNATATLQQADERVTYWLPIDEHQDASWLMISASLQASNQWGYELMMGLFARLAAITTIALLLFILTVRKSVNVIRDSAEFAENIISNPDSELTQHSTSEELRRLVDALNRVCKHWHHRLLISEQSTTHLRMHKVAIDLHAAVCITNGNGRIEYVNKHFCLASGYEEKELLSKNIGILNSGYHDALYFKNLWRTLVLGRIWQGELCNRNKHGELYWVRSTIAPIKDHLGRPGQFIAIQTSLPRPHRMESLASAKR